MVKKFGLGKGLEALIPGDTNVEETKTKDGFVKIDIDSIDANIDQPRKFFDNSKIAELSQSIKEHGIIQPLIVQKVEEDKYTIIAGERRWRAAKLAKVKKVPVIIKEMSNEELLQISLIENIQRENLNAIEEALAYKKLKEEFNLTQEVLSRKLGKSRTAIANVMRLLNLDSRVQEYIIQGVISEGHGKVLLSLSGDEQYKVAQKIIDDGLSVREVESFIKFLKSKENKEEQPKEEKKMNPYYKDIKDKLQDYFGTKVNINSNKNKGKIEIEYYSEEDLQRILDIINL
ncbi:ParB/RepB/Spo0J family partition protein [Clostridium mediterraneense]|uniref:ParB/RepB/Spo0J family partition protein n=1 Tax=Clostridium mediterraneense TaxID=1805472 RepID=UPI00082EAAFB|nr:ParB/RepB/Spo0J family partition protein [Clostridium mediterraneense]